MSGTRPDRRPPGWRGGALRPKTALWPSSRWALARAWETSPRVLAGVVAVAVLRGLIPAGLALSARGIVNGAVAGMGAVAGTGAVAGAGALAWMGELGPLAPWLALGFALTLLEGLAGLLAPLLRTRLRDGLGIRLTGELLAHAATLDLVFFEDPRAQDLLQRAKDNPAGHVTSGLVNAISAISTGVQVVSLLAILVAIEPWVAVVLLILALPYLVQQWRLAADQHALEHARTTQRRWTGYFMSTLTGAATAGEVRLLRLAPLLGARFAALMEEFRRQDWRLALRGARRGAGIVTLSTTVVYAAVVHVAWRALQGGVSIGDLAIFGAATARMRLTLETFAGLAGATLTESLAIADVMAFLAERPRRAAAAPAVTPLPAPARGEIELRAVRFTYPGAAAPAIDDLSLHIAAGETIAVVGENGAGKTTLVKLIAHLYEPDAGTILFDGVDLRALAPAALHEQVACVFQGFGRFEASAADNIAYGDWTRLLDDRRSVEAVAQQAGVAALIEALPRGYDTSLGRGFGETDLSAGQWQALAVARAFARPAALLLLDEPTAHLDPRAERALLEQFRVLAHGRTTILVSHRLTTVVLADRIVVLHAGRIVEVGTHAELLARGEHYATLHALYERRGPGAEP